MTDHAIAADWVVTGKPEEPPIADGAVVYDARGKVLAVGAAAALRSAYPAAEWSSERAILLPGLVNAHVHLELSALRGQVRGGAGFGPWVGAMLAKRRQLSPELDLEAIDAAVSELLAAGTVAVGEVTNSLAAVPALASAPLLARVFHEVYGLSEATGRAMLDQARRTRAEPAILGRNVSYVLAPHTLYSLHPTLVREIVADARRLGLRTSLHLSEHPAERAFLRDGSGPFADFLAAQGISREGFEPPGCAPVAYAERLGVLSPDVLAVHLCDTGREELARASAQRAPAVLCPRSNLFIEVKLPPLHDLLDVGLRPALGTDSLASNTTLDVLAEASALRERFPQVPPRLLFSMATWFGARALGLERRIGALSPGLSPGLLAVDLAAPVLDPLAFILRSPPPRRRVLCRPAMPSDPQRLGDSP